MACRYYGNCEHQSGWCQSDRILIKCVYGLNKLCREHTQKIVKLEEENEELKQLRADYEKQKSINYEWVEENQELVKENAELKRLLRLAVDEITKQKLYADFGIMCRSALCKSCKTRSITNRVCQVCNYEYEHAEEVMKLIGDDE
ncbi:MAG: hypothetical protein ACI4Q5_03820 [Porcipelethomonas sp.]